MWEQVEVLEDHPDLAALFRCRARMQFVEFAAAFGVADECPVDVETSRVDAFEMVDTPQKRRFAGAGRADQARDVPALYLE